MKCPNCLSDDVRRSRRRGPREGITLRIKHQAPYRCRQCDFRFVGAEDDGDGTSARRQVSFADYLGLRGTARSLLSDRVILGTLGFLLFITLIVLFFALAFGWINPLSWFPEGTWRPTTQEMERITRE